MARATSRPRQSRIRYLEPRHYFQYKLVLNQWLLTRFAIDSLATEYVEPGALRPVQVLAKTLRHAASGLDAARHHHYLNALLSHRQAGWAYSEEDLRRFDANIVRYTDAINQRRPRLIEWKYFQWLTLLFVEIYLQEYFLDRKGLLASLNIQSVKFNQYYSDQGLQTGIEGFAEADLNKLCLQNATGSGKTLLMHVNVHQFRHYALQAGKQDDYGQIILLSPNERLTEQHARELHDSGLPTERLVQDAGLLADGRKALSTLSLTEITKLGETQGDKRMAVDSFGDVNLLLVDEGHRGLGSASEEKGWIAMRDKLAGRGFTFEYSATFKEAVVAARDREVEASYAKSILFDYGYRYFYEDGYGKDYRIFNLPADDTKTHQFNYLIAALLSFYQQLRLFSDKKHEFYPYNLARPLWVFVGASVIKDDGKKVTANEYDERVSDIALILKFLAQVLANPPKATVAIDHVLNGNGRQTGLLDEDGLDIFAGSFSYLKALGQKPSDVYLDICRHVFQTDAPDNLIVERITGDSGELLLKVGEADQPFGLINVGDAAGLADHLEKACPELDVRKSEFDDPIFTEVHRDSSPVNVLLGSKKFVEGWDCWRVSSMGLMNTGKKEGSQIIQLFGRGVRLMGRDMSLMRTSRMQPMRAPQHIHLLETLNVFGVGADFMAQFRDFLKEEGLPGNEQTNVHTVKLNVASDIGKKLKMLRPKVRKDTHQAYNFAADGPRIRFGGTVSDLALPPDIAKGRLIELDKFPRLEGIKSEGAESADGAYQATMDEGKIFDSVRLAFLDFDRLYLDVEQYVRSRGYANLLITQDRLRPLLLSSDWYRIRAPEEIWALSMANRLHWQLIALELLGLLCDRVYNHHKRAYLEPRLELVPLTEAPGNLPTDSEYRLVVDGSESALIDDIKGLKQAFDADGKSAFDPGRESVRGLRLGIHLYNPILSARSDRIRIEPVALNDSEYAFVHHLKVWFDANEGELKKTGEQLYLLRNLVRHGIGFFEAGGFWPDFILWRVMGKHQRIVFIDPHGLTHEGPGSEKIEFGARIKGVQARMSDPDVELESIIIAPESSRRLRLGKLWGKSDKWFIDHNVLFMSDGADTYTKQLMAIVRR